MFLEFTLSGPKIFNASLKVSNVCFEVTMKSSKNFIMGSGWVGGFSLQPKVKKGEIPKITFLALISK